MGEELSGQDCEEEAAAAMTTAEPAMPKHARRGDCYVDGAGQGVPHKPSPGTLAGRFMLYCVRCGATIGGIR